MQIPKVNFHPPSPSNALVDIVDLENLYQRRKTLDHSPEKPHRTDFNLLIYIDKGEGEHFIDFSHRAFAGGTFIFVREQQVHAFDFSNQLQGKAILFTNGFIEAIQNSMEMPAFSPAYLNRNYSPVFNPSPVLLARCKRLLLEIDEEIAQHNAQSLVLMFLFSSLFLLINREKIALEKSTLNQKQNEKFTQFIGLLEQQFTQTRNAADYAAQLHTTYKTLNTICKLATGKTAKQLIDAYTILEAKRRLTLDKKPIQKLADELGFDETTNFVKYFKKHTAHTPTDFTK